MYDLRRVATGILATIALGFVAACSEAGQDPVSPQQPGAIQLGNVPSAGEQSADPSVLETEYFKICKVWVGVSDPSSFSTTVTVNVTGGTTSGPHNFTLTGNECKDAWINGGPTHDDVTATESGPAGFTTTVARDFILDGGSPGSDTGNSGAVDGDSGVLVTWTNTLIPTGGEGCTPGYWKNHAGIYSHSKGGQNKPSSWVGFDPLDDFDTTFGVDLFSPDITLIDALNLGGGGNNALARHAVAGLLSAAHPGVDYDYTVAEVIALVQAGDKDALATANEQGCPL